MSMNYDKTSSHIDKQESSIDSIDVGITKYQSKKNMKDIIETIENNRSQLQDIIYKGIIDIFRNEYEEVPSNKNIRELKEQKFGAFSQLGKLQYKDDDLYYTTYSI